MLREMILGKKGSDGIKEIVKIIVILLILIISAWALIYLFGGKGKGLLDSVKNIFRVGR